MSTLTTTEAAGKRMRNGSVILTDRMCERRVATAGQNLRPQMPRPPRQHHYGWHVLLQIHRPGDRQAEHPLAWRLQPRDLRRRACSQPGPTASEARVRRRRKFTEADIANLFPCELDLNMLPRDGSGA